MSTSDEAATARLQRQEAQLRLIYTAVSLGVVAWYLIPQHQKKLWAMAAAEKTRRLLDLGAHRAGHQAMGLELSSGRRDFYNLPYVLSVARDKARDAYERLRSVGP